MTEAHPPHRAPRSGGSHYSPSGSSAPAESGAISQHSAQPYEPYPPSPQPYSSYQPYQSDTQSPSLQQPAQAQPYQQPVPGQAHFYQQAQPYQQPVPVQPPRRRRTGLIVLIIALVIVLVAGGGTAAWWFVLRDRGTTYEPAIIAPAGEWADGARQEGSSTITRDSTIAVSPDGSFLAALSRSESSGTGRSGSRKEQTLTGYSLSDGQATESWQTTITAVGSTSVKFWGNDTVILGSTLYDAATGNERDAPWSSGTVSIVNDLAVSCKDGSCTAWKQDGSTAWNVDVGEGVQISEGVIVRGGKRYAVAGATVINVDSGDSFTLDVPDAPHIYGSGAQDGWVVQTVDDDFRNGHLYTFAHNGKPIGETAIENDPDRTTYTIFPSGTMLSVKEISARLSGEDEDGPKDKRAGEYTEDDKECTLNVTMDNGATFESPEIRAYRDGRAESTCPSLQVGTSATNRVTWFYDVGGSGPPWAIYAMVDATTGKSIDIPGLEPEKGDFLVFANPSTAVGYSPRNGTLTTYTPAG